MSIQSKINKILNKILNNDNAILVIASLAIIIVIFVIYKIYLIIKNKDKKNVKSNFSDISSSTMPSTTMPSTTIPSTISSTSSSLVTLPIQGIRISINMGTDVIPESLFLDNNIKIFGLLMYDETGAMISSSRVNNTVSTSMKPGYSKTAYYTGLANYQISNNKTRTYNDMISASNKFTSTISGLTTTDTNIALPPKFTFDDMDNKYTYASSTNGRAS